MLREPITDATPWKAANSNTAMTYPGGVRNHIQHMPGANQPNAKIVPSKNCVRGRVVPLVVIRAKIAIPMNASGHQPHGGRLNATSVPEPSAVK
jgi:hypothetical protein